MRHGDGSPPSPGTGVYPGSEPGQGRGEQAGRPQQYAGQENGQQGNGQQGNGQQGKGRRKPGWRGRRARRKQIRAARRTIVGRHPFLAAFCAVILVLTPVWVSLGQALTDPGLGSSVGARGAEWLRTHGFSSVVNWTENQWYSHHPPPVGGKPASSAIPKLGSGGSGFSRTTVVHLPTPKRMTSPAGHRLPGEGVWHPVGRRVGKVPAVYETWVRPDAVHTSLVIGVAWMDTRLLRATLYSGSTIPGGGPFKHSAPIRKTAAKSLVSAFNAGFLMSNADGGYYTNGRKFVPLRTGAASFVIYKNGSANIVAWGHGKRATLGPDVVSVRQNLDLLVKGGRPIPGLNPDDTTQWGFTLGNAVYVWRSGVGITRNGALVYAGGPGLNITTLADILARAGAVRAMELDINTDWVNYATYRPHGAHAAATPGNGKNLLPDMFGGPDRYFASWWSRDFITMSARTPQRKTVQVRHRPGHGAQHG